METYKIMKNRILKFWVYFWVKRGRCPICFSKFFCYNDYGIEFSYCIKHMEEAYYNDGTKVKFGD